MNIRKTAIIGTGIAMVAGLGAASIGVAAASPGAKRALDTTPGQITVINAATDPQGAVDALKLYEDATDRSFTPTGTPSYSQTKWGVVTDMDGNPAPVVIGNSKTKQSVTERLEVKHETSSSWSLGGSIETTMGFDLAEVVDAELSVKFTANHTWESSSADTQGIWVTALPGKAVWIEASTSTASYTGNFEFTSGGARYEVDNVTITQPASPTTDAMAVTNYRVMETNSKTAGVPADTTGGLTTLNALPRLGAYIAAGH
jgi:hypothetical protein